VREPEGTSKKQHMRSSERNSMKRLSWKYIAGLVDGEGCIDFELCKLSKCRVKNKNRRNILPRIRITLTDKSLFILESLKTNHGGHISHSDLKGNKKYNSNWNAASWWELHGRQARPFLQNIVNHTYIKKEQIKFLIWWIDNMMGKRINVLGNENMDAVRMRAHDELKAMKKDPQRLSERAEEEILKIYNSSDAIV
jgi:hypothetical protein